MSTKWTSKKTLQEVHKLFLETQLTYQAIADKVGVTRKVIIRYVHKSFSKDFIKKRKVKSYMESKLGSKNPMYSKKGADHPNYKGIISDGKGYLLVLKPEWYTGRNGSKHIFYHHYIYCSYNNLTEIPKGYVIHHIDGNPCNNHISNLMLLLNIEHINLHRYGGAETISSESRVQEDSKRLGAEAHDMVRACMATCRGQSESGCP